MVKHTITGMIILIFSFIVGGTIYWLGTLDDILAHIMLWFSGAMIFIGISYSIGYLIWKDDDNTR